MRVCKRKSEIVIRFCILCNSPIPCFDLSFAHYQRANYCSRSCAYARPREIRTYKYAPGTRIHLHRFLMQEKLGRKLATNEHVHHIDGNKLNNSLDNLEVLSSSEHTRRHQLKRQLIANCTWCKKEFFTKNVGFKTCSKVCGRKQSVEKRRKVSVSTKICIAEHAKRGQLFHSEIGYLYNLTQSTVSSLIREWKANGTI